MRTDPYDDLCLSCGYDLRGLKMPHACPECGEVRDPEQDEKKAREWFAKFRLSLLWPLRLCDTPRGVWYLLGDRLSQRNAKRRRFRWLWLPTILMIFFVCPATLVSFEYEVVTTYYQTSGSKLTAVRTIEDIERYGLFRWDSFRFNSRAQRAGVQETEHRFRRVCFGTEGVCLDPYTFGVLPLVGALIGYYVSHYLLISLANRQSRELSGNRQSAPAVSAILAPMLGLSLWGWFALWVFEGTRYLVDYYAIDVSLVSCVRNVLSLLSIGNWILTCLGGWYLLLRMDDAQLVVKWRLLVALLLVAISLGFPLGLVWALGKVL